MNDRICPLCDREMPDGSYNSHHLIPATFKGKKTIDLHIMCHDKLHHTFSEREMEHYYHTMERLLEHEEIQKFIKWVSKQPPDYYSHHKDTQDRKRKRKRR